MNLWRWKMNATSEADEKCLFTVSRSKPHSLCSRFNMYLIMLSSLTGKKFYSIKRTVVFGFEKLTAWFQSHVMTRMTFIQEKDGVIRLWKNSVYVEVGFYYTMCHMVKQAGIHNTGFFTIVKDWTRIKISQIFFFMNCVMFFFLMWKHLEAEYWKQSDLKFLSPIQ